MPNARILVVDDEEAIREVVTTLLGAVGYDCSAAANALHALESLARNGHDLVLSDVVMPEMDGLKLLERIRQKYEDVPVIMITAVHDISTALDALRKGAYDYILKPFEKEQLYLSVQRALEHRRLVLENQNYQRNLEQLVQERTRQLSMALRELEKSYDYTLEALGGALDLKDSETEGHCQRVTAFTIAMAKAMDIKAEELRVLARAAFLHDIGKMGIPDEILRKPTHLTAEEINIVRKHCDIGYRILERIPFLKEAAEIVRSHQERFDGTGYPRGLKSEAIPLGARIFAVADTLDAMISDRPYRKALSLEAAKAEIRRCAGTQFDPRVVEVFFSLPDSLWDDLRRNVGEPLRLAGVETQ